MVLNNFITQTWPEDCNDKLRFLLKQKLKLAKQGIKMTFIDNLQSKLEPKYRLDMSQILGKRVGYNIEDCH